MNKKVFQITYLATLIATIVITILSNFKFANYDKYFIFPITILLITNLYLINKQKLVINKKGYFLLIPISLIILGTFFLKTNISNIILNVFILPLLISFLFFSLTNKNFDITGSFLKWCVELFPKRLFSNLSVIKANRNPSKEKNKKIENIFFGILLSIPFAIVILSLLTSADLYFGALIEKIIKSINSILNFKFIRNNLFIFGICFIIIFSTFINITKNINIKIANGKKKTVETTIVNTLLVIVNAIFALFIFSEISKLTGNFLQLPLKYTYAEYAREGFFQLLFVTIINFSIIFYLLYKTNATKENKLLKNLVLLLIIFTITLIFNSYYRMFLYMYEYGFTILRTQVVLFLLMELIISLITIKKIIHGLKHKDGHLLFGVIITTYVINIFICNVDVINFLNHLINK